ncbi:MAG: hypothetical protein COA30_00945 [Sulfurimonas sp.]|nr:MAG: hypothetical protein COA30_00945 [Sulfurimonas sp.]
MTHEKITFFTEGGTSRGMGHLIRCYALYEELKRLHYNVSFYLDSDIDFTYKFNDIKYFKWKDFSLDDTYDIVFIDSYLAPLNIYHIIMKNSKLTVYIDDYGRLEYPSGLIVNFAPDAEKLFFQKKSKKNTYLLGLKYIPIRKEFINAKSNKKEKQLFIILGGTDKANLSMDICDALKEIDIKKVIVTAEKELATKLSKFSNTTILYKPDDVILAQNMSQSSIAISTASMSLYELSFLEIPTLLFATSKNQEIGIQQLINNSMAVASINHKEDLWKKELQTKINIILKTNPKASPKIDGQGIQRIVKTSIRLLS